MRTGWCLLCLLLVSGSAFGQEVLWEVQEDFNGGTDLARAVTLSKKTAVVIGNVTTPNGGGSDFVVQSLRRPTGAVQWTDSVASCCGLLPLQIASFHGQVFATGYVAGADSGSTDIAVRAYDGSTGTVVWSGIWDTGRDDVPQAIAAGPTAVVVVGYGGDTPDHDAIDFIVRAYDPLSGDVLWEDRLDRSGLEAAAWSVAIDRNRVFVAGTTAAGGGTVRDLIVRAYNASSGALLWEATRPTTAPIKLEATSGRVFVVGTASSNGYLGVFNGKTGALLWEDVTPVRGSIRDVAVEGDRVVACGSAQAGLFVRAYDALSGSVEWQDQPVVPPGFSEFATTVVLNDTTVYVGGTSGKDLEYSEMMVRAYDAATGTLRWDDRSHRSSGMTVVADMALGPKRLFVAGSTTSGSADFLIRAYRATSDATPTESSARQ